MRLHMVDLIGRCDTPVVEALAHHRRLVPWSLAAQGKLTLELGSGLLPSRVIPSFPSTAASDIRCTSVRLCRMARPGKGGHLRRAASKRFTERIRGANREWCLRGMTNRATGGTGATCARPHPSADIDGLRHGHGACPFAGTTTVATPTWHGGAMRTGDRGACIGIGGPAQRDECDAPCAHTPWQVKVRNT